MELKAIYMHDDETMQLFSDNKQVGYYDRRQDKVFAFDKDGYAFELGTAPSQAIAIDMMRNHLNA